MSDYIYASFHCSEKMFRKLFENSEYKPGQAVQKYNRLLAEGLAKCDNTKVTAVSELPITEKNFSPRWFHRINERIEGVQYIYIPLLNIHRMKDVLAVITAFIICLRNSNAKDVCYISDILNAPVALGAYWAAKISRKKYIAVVTDAPKYVYFDSDKFYRHTSDYLISRATGYIFLTEYMNDLYNPKNKPYIVIEGIVDGKLQESEDNIESNNQEKKVCMYTGSIHRKYGISNLVDGFKQAKIANAELHIYGDGDFRTELEEICMHSDNIKYFGNVLSSDVVKIQQSASLLINPRPISEEFTKYSFPSKNMEYMLSGVPTLTTKLPGMPKEYEQYVYLIEDDSPEGIARALVNVLALGTPTLSKKGQEAKKFVIEKKNSVVQARRIMHAFSDKN